MEKIETLIKLYFDNYNEYIENTIDYPDEAKDDFEIFRNVEKEILEYFGFKQQQKINKVLYSFIEDSCYEKRIEYSTQIGKQIIKTMEKLKQVQQFEAEFGKFFKQKLKEFENSQPIKKDDLPNVAGIYVFYKYGQPIYVGRTDRIRQRIQEHVRPSSGSGSATFAFNLAKIDYVKNFGEIKSTRTELEIDDKFSSIFKEKKKYLSDCEYKILEIENDILQTMIEPYLAYKLGTYPIYNTFENH